MEIDILIDEEADKEDFNKEIINILIELKKCNRQAYLHMRQVGKTWGQKYREMWKKKFWKRGRRLLYRYFEIKGELECPFCHRKIGKKFTLHHEEEFYNFLNCFHPDYVMLVHQGCHSRHHFRIKKKKK